MRAEPHEAGADVARPFFARAYAAAAPRIESGGLGQLRDELLAGVAGHVLEVGCGNGMNFSHYPASVSTVHAVEPEPHLRELARKAATTSTVEIIVTGGTGSALPAKTESVDAVVLCMVLCSVPHPDDTVAEMRRVLRPGGSVVVLEHRVSRSRSFRVLQKMADATLWPIFMGGCHLGRDPMTLLRDGGFVVDEERTPHYPGGLAGRFEPYVLGRASRP